MKLSPAKKQEILDQAELLSMAEPKKERAQFKKDHIQNTTKINNQIGKLLDKVMKESTPILLAYSYNVPGLAQQRLMNLRVFLTTLTQQILDNLVTIESASVRKLSVNFIKNTLKILHESITDKQETYDKRKGNKKQ